MLDLISTRTKKRRCGPDGLSCDSRILFVVTFSMLLAHEDQCSHLTCYKNAQFILSNSHNLFPLHRNILLPLQERPFLTNASDIKVLETQGIHTPDSSTKRKQNPAPVSNYESTCRCPRPRHLHPPRKCLHRQPHPLHPQDRYVTLQRLNTYPLASIHFGPFASHVRVAI